MKKFVTSEVWLGAAEAEPPECIRKYMGMASTTRTQDVERSRIFHRLGDIVAVLRKDYDEFHRIRATIVILARNFQQKFCQDQKETLIGRIYLPKQL